MSSVGCMCPCHDTTSANEKGCFLCQESHYPLNFGSPDFKQYTITSNAESLQIIELLKEIRDLLKSSKHQ